MADDLQLIKTYPDDPEVVLTADFNGGPLVIDFLLGAKQTTRIFYADPYFRRPDHYLAAGSLVFTPPLFPERRCTITLRFANQHRQQEARFTFQLSSPYRLRSGSGKPPVLFHHSQLTNAVVAAQTTRNVVLQIWRYPPTIDVEALPQSGAEFGASP